MNPNTMAWLLGSLSTLNWGYKDAKRNLIVKVDSTGVGSYLLQGLQTISYHCCHN